MEDPIDNRHELEEFEDTLSLRDLPIYDYDETELDVGYRNSVSDQDFSFELSATTYSEPEIYTQFDDFMFPRRITKPVKNGSFNDPEINSLFPLNSPSSFSVNNDSKSPFAFSNSISRVSSTGSAIGSGRHVSSSSAIARKRHGVFIGLARMPPRMELSEIKKRAKRQSKRSPRPMFPEAEVGGDAGRVKSGLLGPLRHRSLLLSVLAKASHGCIPRV